MMCKALSDELSCLQTGRVKTCIYAVLLNVLSLLLLKVDIGLFVMASGLAQNMFPFTALKQQICILLPKDFTISQNMTVTFLPNQTPDMAITFSE